MEEARCDWLFADPFFTTEAQEMSRAFDPVNIDEPPAAAPQPAAPPVPLDDLPPPTPNRRPVQHTVCPFCGYVAEVGSATCKHCGLENSHATRTATRNKIGPWFVWQARNPSAPGMNWATLMSLVEKGRITPRSIMRGPTTGQLWRFAARVKGVSREFGICWHCGGSIQNTARVCSACKRLQQPPINADMLLETDASQTAQSRPLADPRGGGLLSLAQQAGRDASADAAAPPEEKSPMTRAAAASEMLSGALPIIDMGADAIPAAAEMRAFELPAVHNQKPRNLHLGRKMLLAAVIALACGGGAAWYSPDFLQYCRHSYDTLLAHVATANHQLLHNADATDNSALANGQANTDPKTDSPDVPTPLMNAPVAANDTKVDIGKSLTPAQVNIGPGDGGAAPAVQPATVASVAAVPAAARTVPENSVVVTPPPTDPQTAESRAWELRDRAIEAERRSDFTQAVKDYQWIEKMGRPDGVGPSDIDTRLQLAQKAATGTKN